MSSHVLPADALAPGGAAVAHPNALAPLARLLDQLEDRAQQVGYTF